MDGRWLLLSLAVAIAAAVRLRHRTPPSIDPAPGPSTDSTDPTRSTDPTGPATSTEPAGRRAPRPPRGAGVPDRADELDELVTVDGLDEALAEVWAQHADDVDTLLDARLRQIVRRGVPARAIRPAPGTRSVRVVFADGTVLLCRGTGQGDFGRLGLALLHHSVRLGSYAREAGGTRLDFRWHPDQHLAAVAVGLDQPD
jgi:hypothetical protein